MFINSCVWIYIKVPKMLLLVGSYMDQNIQFSHTMAIWFQLQYYEQTIPDRYGIFIPILILGLISRYNLYTSLTLLIIWTKFDYRPDIKKFKINNLFIFWLPIEFFVKSCWFYYYYYYYYFQSSEWGHSFHKNPLYEFKWYIFQVERMWKLV